jgi:hypothetical protein
MLSPERLAEATYDLLRIRKSESGRFPADRLPSWTELPAFSKSDLVLLFREVLRIMALDEEEKERKNKWR